MKKSWFLLFPALILCLIIVYFFVKTPIARRENSQGLILYDSASYLPAEKHFSRALLWKSNYPDAIINIVKSQLAREDSSAAEKYLLKLKKRIPESAETYTLEGRIRVLEKRYGEAARLLTRAIEKDSLLPDAWFYRGIAQANLGFLEEAAADYLKTQEIDKNNKKAFREGAIVFSLLDNFGEAIENYDRLLELDPSNTSAYLERAGFKQKIGDLKGAIADYDKVIKLDPKSGEAWFGRGKSHAENMNYESAIADFTKSAELNYRKSGALNNIGLSYMKLSKPGKAKSYLLESVRIDKEKENTSKSYYLLGVLYMMKEEHEKALSYFDKSLNEDPEFADAYYNRGIAYGMMEKYEEAINDLKKCMSLGKESAEVYFALGVQKMGLRQMAEGCKDLARAANMGYAKAIDMQKKYCKQYLP